MIKLPKSIKVGGIDYKILFPYVFKENINYLGLHDYCNATIKITEYYYNDKVNIAGIYTTLIHELIHAIEHIYLNDEINHNIVEKLAKGWYQVLSDNIILSSNKLPKFIKVGGLKFDIYNDYEFEDSEDTYIVCNIYSQKIFITKNYKDLNHDFLMQILFRILNNIIIFVYSEDEDINSEYLDVLSNGIYQVFKDAKIEQFIKGGE